MPLQRLQSGFGPDAQPDHGLNCHVTSPLPSGGRRGRAQRGETRSCCEGMFLPPAPRAGRLRPPDQMNLRAVRLYEAGCSRHRHPARLAARHRLHWIADNARRCRARINALAPPFGTTAARHTTGPPDYNKIAFYEERQPAEGANRQGVGLWALALAATSDACPSDSLSVATLLRVTNLQEIEARASASASLAPN